MKLPGIALTAALALLLFASCGDDGAAEPTPTATDAGPTATTDVSGSPTETPTASPTPTTTPTPEPADETVARALATSASYFLYVAGDGDTLGRVARVFGAEPGPEGTLTAFWTELRDLNQLPTTTLALGQVVALPLEPESFEPEATLPVLLRRWLTAGGSNGLEMFWPSDRLIEDGYQGALALQTVQASFQGPEGAVDGYSLYFVETDRPVFKGGDLDPAARVEGRAFEVHCGPIVALIDPGPGDTAQPFGGQCLIVVPPGSELDAAILATAMDIVRVDIG